MSENIKVLGRDVGPGDWIGLNCHGVMRLGRVLEMFYTRQGFKDALLQDTNGDRFHWDINLGVSYPLFTFSKDTTDESRYDDELIHMMRGIGRASAHRFARSSIDRIKSPGHDYKYTSRDGRIIFKDGSSIRINDDQTRTLFDAKGTVLEWPRLKSAS